MNSPDGGDSSPTSQNLSTRASSLIRRSAHVMHDVFAFPFSNQALSSLPTNPEGRRERATRVDNIPDQQDDAQHPNYQSITGLPGGVRIPKKIASPIKVEAKVWFANERTWISYVNVCILLGTLSAALFNASKDAVARNLAYTYAFISLSTLCYSYVLYQRRVTMIRRRDPSHFDALVGPVLICVALFVAVLTNFIIRLREYQKQNPSGAPQQPTPW
ncbi:hypothetical protein FRB95_011864 [Tulasnella sp. JGI-2019a]|nr:hypothetical protein FRB93_000331 [Tulasnella sp. JGI-2019a]KAG9039279.1 hypothetical protein FRB95_011864 [Tulasnella sp. JGI-2019a]